VKQDQGCPPKGGLYKTRSWLNRSSWLENCKPRAGHSMLCPYGEKYTGGENGAHFLRENVRGGGHGRQPRAGHSMLCPYGERYTGGENGARFLRENVRGGGHGRQPRAGHSMVRLRSPQVLCPYEGWWRGGERAGKWR